jgi:aspartyl/asparaginyl-tRNA synthetase
MEQHQKVSEAQRDCHARLQAAFAQHKQREDELTQAIERLRLEKDAQIRVITKEREESRSTYEIRISELEIIIKNHMRSIAELRGIII